MSEKTVEDLEAEESMFVQMAAGVTSDGARLTLHGVAPGTLYFSDRPQRVVGHMATAHFVELWGEGDNSFEADPPNAMLAYLESDADLPNAAVVVLTEPRLDVGGLSYAFDVLKGAVPSAAGPVSLFIDPFGMPRSPVDRAR